MALVSDYARLVELTSDLDLGPNGVPPSEQQVFQLVIDPNNSTMVTTGLYTQDEATQKRNDAMAYLLVQFGIDFANGTPDPVIPGAAIASGWEMFPYASGVKIGSQIDVAFDSVNIARGVTGTWHGFQFGQVCGAGISGVFPGGLHAGEKFVAGDVLAYFDYNLLNSNGNPPSPQQKREVLIMRSPWTSKNILNSQGYIDTLSKLEVVDSNGNVGFVDESIMFQKDIVTTDVTGKTRVTITWPNSPSYKALKQDNLSEKKDIWPEVQNPIVQKVVIGKPMIQARLRI
jgi:hypothetical protein